MYDAVIIGAGVTGAAAAWALSRLCANICVLERTEDSSTVASIRLWGR